MENVDINKILISETSAYGKTGKKGKKRISSARKMMNK